MATSNEVWLTQEQQLELRSIAQSRSLPAGYVFRAKLILMLAEGASFNTIKHRLQTSAPTIIRWKQRFLQSGLDGLDTYHPGQKATVLTPALRARILSATRKKPSDGSTHWSCRKLAAALGVSKDAVHRVWKEAGLKPHRLERYLASDDPEFETKAADILGLYLRPPQHAAVFCVDEKPRSKPWIGSTRSCRFRQDAPSVTASSTTGMGRCRSMRRSTPRPAACTEKPQLATPAATSSLSWKKCCPCARPGSRFISSSTISRPTKPKPSEISSSSIREFGSTSRPPTPPGSTKSNSGSPKSNAR